MKPVPTIKSQDPVFLDTVLKFDVIVELHADQRKIKIGQKFIRYLNGKWEVCKMSQERMPRLCGRFDSLPRAVFRARLSI
jgi:hypothetical protein